MLHGCTILVQVLHPVGPLGVAAVQLRSPTGLHCFGIRLQPAASAVLAGSVLPALTDQIVDLDSLVPSFAQLIRLQAAIKLLDTQPSSLAALAGDTGFADQAHATRALQHRLGITPLRLLKALQQDLNADNTVQLAAAFVRGHSG